MKPLTLEVFPRRHSTFPVGYVLPRGGYMTIRGADKAATAKHLTATELAAKYHQQRAYALEMVNRTTAAHDTTNWDRAETLRRFATNPHAGDEQ